MQVLQIRSDGCLCRVKLAPNAGKNRVDGPDRDTQSNLRLRVKGTAIPEKGKANAALIKLLAKEWGLAKSQLTIISGEKDRNKIVHVAVDPPFFIDFFDKWAEKFSEVPQE